MLRSDSFSSLPDAYPVEYSYQDTFTTLLEKCMLALNIRLAESSSTARSSEDPRDQSSRASMTKQALMYDKDHTLITMLQEVKEGETYCMEIIDSRLLAVN